MLKKLFVSTKWYQALLILPLCLSLTGCWYIVIGSVGVVGGYVISPDTVEGLTENPFDDVWDTAVDIVSVMGTISEQSREVGILIAKIQGTKVTLTITSITKTTTKLNVKGRKAFLPKVSVAQDVFVKVMSQLNE